MQNLLPNSTISNRLNSGSWYILTLQHQPETSFNNTLAPTIIAPYRNPYLLRKELAYKIQAISLFYYSNNCN